jgi:hypothetical protein
VGPGSLGRGYDSIWGSASDDVYAVSWGGIVSRFDGASWTVLPDRAPIDLRAIWGSGPDHVVAVGYHGGFSFQFDGSVWALREHAGQATMFGLHGQSRDRFIAVGVDGVSFLDDGERWLRLECPTSTWDLQDVWCSPSGSAYAVTLYGGILGFGE